MTSDNTRIPTRETAVCQVTPPRAVLHVIGSLLMTFAGFAAVNLLG